VFHLRQKQISSREAAARAAASAALSPRAAESRSFRRRMAGAALGAGLAAGSACAGLSNRLADWGSLELAAIGGAVAFVVFIAAGLLHEALS
jgi:hypothetical protein